jgi:dTDP-4-dehydrorhamnose 3,5-epimerase
MNGHPIRMKKLKPVKDKQLVTSDGEPVTRRIDGLVIRPARTQLDPRGELCEIYNPAWGIHPEPMVYAYHATVRPKAIKGWVMHRLQDDRVFTALGVQRWVFFDQRPKSPTRGMLNCYTYGERNRVLIIIPKGVYHAVQNVGETDAVFVNLPTRAYNHADPDKYRLPPKNDLIPFDFSDEPKW